MNKNTSSGLLAILFWSTTIAFSRGLTEDIGTLTTATYVNLVSGFLGCSLFFINPGSFRRLLSNSVKYLVGCGALFVAYMVCIYLAVGFSSGRQQVLTVSMINYIWPSLTLIFSIPVLGKKARKSLFLGIIIASLGVFLAIQGGEFSNALFLENFRSNQIPYALALIAALCWGLYSTLSRRWGGKIDFGAVPIFLLITGFTFLAMKLFFFRAETPQWTPVVAIQLLYMAIFPSLLSYMFWDIGIRKGDHSLLASFSYLIPLFSMVTNGIYLQVRVNILLWVSTFLVVIGAIICKNSILD